MDEELHLVPGATYDAMCGAWAHGIGLDKFAKVGADG